MSNRKIRKLTDMIDAGKKDVGSLERKLALAKDKCDDGQINKAEFTKVRIQLSEGIRGKRTMIARWEKARLNEERRLRKKKEEEEEEHKKKEEMRAERRREREKDKRRRSRALEDGGDGEGAEGEPAGEDEHASIEQDKDEGEKKKKKKGFFSFFR
jgi:hypothetical protein